MFSTDLNEYRKMTAKEVWDEIDYNYAINDDSIVYRLETDEYNIMVSVTNWKDEGVECCCEIEEASNCGLVAQGFGDTAQEALHDAIVDMVSLDVLREEDNCEDAVNGIAYEAYQIINGHTPMYKMDVKLIDELKGYACAIVKRYGRFYGIEWEEFRIGRV